VYLGGEDNPDQLAKAVIMIGAGGVVTGILLWVGYVVMKKDDKEEAKKRRRKRNNLPLLYFLSTSLQ
jgi:hypothetical protein